MSFLIRNVKKTVYLTTAIITGLCLFMLIFSLTANNTILNPDFHKQLFVKNNIYSDTQKGLKESISSYISGLDAIKTTDSDKQKAIFLILQKSITPEITRHNLDSIRVELFQYLRGERKFLPDIYLNTQPEISDQSLSDIYSGSSLPLSSLSGIDKISLNTILQYINREDINDYILILKLFYYLLSIAPGFLLLTMLLLALIGIHLCKKFKDALRWTAYSLLICGFLGILTSIILYIYSWAYLPKNIYPVTLTLPLEHKVVLAYIRDCISPFIISLLFIGLFSIVVFFVFIFLPKLKSFFLKDINENSKYLLGNTLFIKNIPVEKREKFASQNNQNKKQIISKSIYVGLLIIILTGIGYKMYSFKLAFDSNDFSMALEKMRNTNAVTQVIAAKDEAIYTLQVKVVDTKTGNPIPNVHIIINGKSAIGVNFNNTASTDATGIAKFSLDKGDFRLSFGTSDTLSGFQIPSPYFFELKTAGTTIITSRLDENSEKEKINFGIAEIEVLDKKNYPVSNIEFKVQGKVLASGYPDNIYSLTDSDGIASFKINEGIYTIIPVESGFSANLILPSTIEVNVKSNSVSRYTIRVTDRKRN